jgi:hypothetical protein
MLFQNRDELRCLRCPVCDLDDILDWLAFAHLDLTDDDERFLRATGVGVGQPVNVTPRGPLGR